MTQAMNRAGRRPSALACLLMAALHLPLPSVADPAAPQAAPAAPHVLVDRFGQTAAPFLQKITRESELQQDAASEGKYYADLPIPDRDRYGGLPGSGKKYGLRPTGYFRVQHAPSGRTPGRWLLVDPDGNAFFQLGICEFGVGDDYTYVGGREGEYAWLPPADGSFATAYKPDMGKGVFSFYLANLIRKYGQPFDPDAYAARMIGRVRRLGFNSGGPFSGAPPAFARADFPYVGTLPLNDGVTPLPGVSGIFDPFDDANQAAVQRNFAAELPRSAKDPRLIGYFLANEPLLEDLPRVLPRLDGSHACKHRLAAFLQGRYGTIAKFNLAWGMQAGGFPELADQSLTAATPTALGDVHDFTGLFLETYYTTVSEAFHRYDPNHLLLGNRFQYGTINDEQLCRIAGKYLDVMSFNYYTNGLDAAFLNRVYRWTGRPLLLSEFFFDSPAESGLSGGSLDMKSQKDRGLAYRDYVEHAAALPFVVGTEWFTLVDQAASGRWFQKYDGERANSGLFSVADRPWEGMLSQAVRTNDAIYPVLFGQRAPFAFDDPRFTQNAALSQTLLIPRAAGPVAMDGTAAGFPGIPATALSGRRLVLGTDAEGFGGDFKACYDDVSLYLLVHVSDPTPRRNIYTGDGIWSGDAVELFLGPEHPDQDGPLLPDDCQVLLSAGEGTGGNRWYLNHRDKQDGVRLTVVPDGAGRGYTLEAAMTFASLGFTPSAARPIRFDLSLDDSADGTRRTRQLVWNGTARDSADRSGWGRARFAP